jgi:DNA-binding NarL/FixJ family response regulator
LHDSDLIQRSAGAIMARGGKLTEPRVQKVLLVDDHPLVREGLSLRVSGQPDLEICGEAASADEALAIVKAQSPDLAIIDIQLVNSSGIELVKEIAARFPRVKMLVVSAYDDSLYAERALRAGALGYINKRHCQEKILEAIRAVLAGRRYVSDDITQRLVNLAVGGGDPTLADPVQQLSDRELEVFQLIGQGLKSSAIANRLFLSVHTIDSHREKIRHKLGLKNGTELMQRAVQWVLDNA